MQLDVLPRAPDLHGRFVDSLPIALDLLRQPVELVLESREAVAAHRRDLGDVSADKRAGGLQECGDLGLHRAGRPDRAADGAQNEQQREMTATTHPARIGRLGVFPYPSR